MVYIATASDPDLLASIRWSLGGDDAAAFTIDSVSVVTFNSSPDYEAHADLSSDNVYMINVIATDGALAPVSKAVQITVKNLHGVTLNDPAGNDTMAGGLGNDRFAFTDSWGADQINDFTNGKELLDLSAVTGLSGFADLSVAQVGSDTEITFAGNTITLIGFLATNLSAADVTPF